MAIHQEVTINKPPKAVYEMLTQAKKFEALGGGAAKISAKPGGAISLFDGYATGFNVELVPGKRVVQAWRASGRFLRHAWFFNCLLLVAGWVLCGYQLAGYWTSP